MKNAVNALKGLKNVLINIKEKGSAWEREREREEESMTGLAPSFSGSSAASSLIALFLLPPLFLSLIGVL